MEKKRVRIYNRKICQNTFCRSESCCAVCLCIIVEWKWRKRPFISSALEIQYDIQKYLHNFPVCMLDRIWPKMLSFSVEKVKSILFA